MSGELVGREFRFAARAGLDLVWEALTTPGGLSSWYVVSAEIDLRPGGRLVADWGAGPTGMGEITDVEPPRRLRLVYDGEGAGAEEWLLDHRDGVTHVRLIHSLPVADGDTWDGTYPGIVRGWELFMGTLRFVAEQVGRLGRRPEVRIGDVSPGAWSRVTGALGLDATPEAGSVVDLSGRRAEVLVAADGFSLLFAVDDEATLLVDVEGDSLYTVAATYGIETEAAAALRASLTAIAQSACRAAAG